MDVSEVWLDSSHRSKAMQSLVAGESQRTLTRRRSWGQANPDVVMNFNQNLRESTASFVDAFEETEDDQARLTQNISLTIDTSLTHDTESRPLSRRRTKRYTAVSPVKMTGSVVKSVSRSLHRASLRVANLSNAGLASQVRLPDDDEEEANEEEDGALQQQQEQRKNTPLRGRTLGFFGPESRVRSALNTFLLNRYVIHIIWQSQPVDDLIRWTEPLILVLIIINVVVLTIQSARSLTLPSNGTITSQGYFHTWEDFALFAIFAVYT